MKILIVSSTNSGQVSPFVFEQVESVKKLGVEIEYYNIVGKGIFGYLKNIIPLKQKVKSYRPDLLHAHYGLSGLLSVLTCVSVPVIVTFHGNDINPINPGSKIKTNWNKYIARLVHRLSRHSIFVTKEIAVQINAKANKSDIIPCQVNMNTFYPIDKSLAREKLGLLPSKKYVLFSSSFTTPIKNYPLAREACQYFDNLELLELRGFTRQEVNYYLNACDLALLTSHNEGSCQFLKEAMACNCPIVSTKVGDSKWIFGDIEGCFITNSNREDVIRNINHALNYCRHKIRTNGRFRVLDLNLDAESISRRVLEVYKRVLNY
jgi:glycosyltransferase involved in cell wall biosynthesis